MIPLSASAQVFKCVDEATGKTTFTDTACPDKGVGNYVPVERTNSDSGYPSDGEIAASKREQERKMQARHAEWDRMAKEQDRGSEAGAGKPDSTQTSTPVPIPMPAPQPTVITNCDTAGCWDNLGNRYNKAAGDTYFRSDGKACQGVGGSMNCN
tara:strand:- start:3013 stop:3474 length:462 start_codon:yes stop_codon:yes gene_type:complete